MVWFWPELLAAAMVVLHAAGWRYCLVRHRRQHPTLPNATPDAVLVAYASQSGQAEALARQTAAQLSDKGPVQVLPLNHVDEDLLRHSRQVFMVISTYGEGEPPDNALLFCRRMQAWPAQHLCHLHFAVLALGDRQYQQFCAFGTKVFAALSAAGARPLHDLLQADRCDLPSVQQWRMLIRSIAGDTAASLPADVMSAFQPWRLQQRRHLNPGSPGGRVFLLKFAVPDGVRWRAGDIAMIMPRNDSSLPLREYSIASLATEGHLALLVREHLHADGRPGIGSGWLCQELVEGGQAMLRLRSHPGFHGPPSAVPMILIGSGTGIAGMRAHLVARQLSNASPDWLIVGERDPLADGYFEEDLHHWQNSGRLARLDQVFSRARQQWRYVQHVLESSPVTLHQYLEQGAWIYVCGSRRGMAEEVDLTLRRLLGDARVDGLLLAGHYRRDVY